MHADPHLLRTSLFALFVAVAAAIARGRCRHLPL